MRRFLIVCVVVLLYGTHAGNAYAIRSGTTDSTNIYYGSVLKFYSNVQPTPPSPVDRTGSAFTIAPRVVVTSALNFKQNGEPSDYAFSMGTPGTASTTIAEKYFRLYTGSADKGNDLAIAFLKSNSAMTANYSALTIATGPIDPGAGVTGRIWGYGLRNDTPSTVGTRRYGDPMISSFNTTASGAYYEVLPQAPNYSLACAGDAGGPLIYNNQVIGLATFAEITDSCSTMTHSQYTAIYPVLNQINDWVSKWNDPSYPCMTWSNVPQNMFVQPPSGQTTATVTWTNPTMTDFFCPDNYNNSIMRIGHCDTSNGDYWSYPAVWTCPGYVNPPSTLSATFPYGTSTVTYTFMDDAGPGHTSTPSFTVTVASPGDANADGRVNAFDLVKVLANFDKTTGMSWATGDFNQDGTVNTSDLSVILTNYSHVYTSSLVAVPEPSSVVLLGISAAGLLRCAWRWLRGVGGAKVL